MDLDAPTTLFLNPKRRTHKMIEDDSLWGLQLRRDDRKLATCVHRSCDWTSSRTWRGTAAGDGHRAGPEKEELRTMGFGQVSHQIRTTCARLASECRTLTNEQRRVCLRSDAQIADSSMTKAPIFIGSSGVVTGPNFAATDGGSGSVTNKNGSFASRQWQLP